MTAGGFLIAALCLTGCGAVKRWDAVVNADSWGRHHGRVVAGPRATFDNGAEVTVQAGRQFAVWAPGEPHYSERAPEDEFQLTAEVVIPIR